MVSHKFFEKKKKVFSLKWHVMNHWCYNISYKQFCLVNLGHGHSMLYYCFTNFFFKINLWFFALRHHCAATLPALIYTLSKPCRKINIHGKEFCNLVKKRSVSIKVHK